jgi:hypothetical protein
MAIKTSFARWVTAAAVCVASLSSTALAIAAPPPPPVPATLTQQGRILDTTGAPVSSKVKIVFNVYAAAKGGTALWTEEQNITLDDGYFSAQLGSITAIPDTVFDGSVRFIGVTVGADDEMTPREPTTSVPYSLIAGSAATAGMAATAASVPYAGITGFPAACPDGQYMKGFMADGTPLCVKVPAMSCHTVVGTTASNATVGIVGCPAGEFATGGGCSTDGFLRSSYIVPPCQGQFCLLCNGTTIACPNQYLCTTSAAATIIPYERCCTVL